MPSYKLSVSISEWVAREIIGKSDNKSGRVEELLIKGFMAEKLANSGNSSEGQKENAAGRI